MIGPPERASRRAWRRGGPRAGRAGAIQEVFDMRELRLGLALAVAACLPAAAQSSSAAAGDFTLVPGERIGPVRLRTTEADLVARFGKANVVEAKVVFDEGVAEAGVTVFPGDAERRLHVVWRDARRTRVKMVRIEGSRWRTAGGLGVGSDLAAVEKLNGGAFDLSGFEWAFGGTVLSWKEGRLAALIPRNLVVRMAPKSKAALGDAEFAKLRGEGTHSSADAAMKSVQPAVSLLIQMFAGEGLGSRFKVAGVPRGGSLEVRGQPAATATVVGRLPGDAAGIAATGPARTVGEVTWRPVRVGRTVGWVDDVHLSPDTATPAPAAGVKGKATRT
jgi:hypothetical protein